MQREKHLWIRRPTPDQILRALEGFASHADPPSRADLDLLVREAGWIGLLSLKMRRFNLTSYFDLGDLGFGLDAIAEAFRDAPRCPKLRDIAREVVTQAGGDEDLAARHFRNIMAKYARNHAKHLLEEIDKARHHVERNARKAIPREMQLGDRMYFLSARAVVQPAIPSDEHVEELRFRCGAGERRIPRLVAATRAILDENRECAPWVHIRQLTLDYHAVMTMGSRWPWPETSISEEDAILSDAQRARDRCRSLEFLRTEGHSTICHRFLSSTALSPDEAAHVLEAFHEHFESELQGEDRLSRFECLAKRMPDLTPEKFRIVYRPAMDRLKTGTVALLVEHLGRDGNSRDSRGGDAP